MKIDDYTLIKKLGEGTFGEVYLTTKENSNDLYATKLIDKSIITKNNSMNYLKNELKILKSINHPNIIRLYKAKESKTHYFFIFEYCNYGTLSSFINLYLKDNQSNKRALPEMICYKLFKEIVHAVNYLHSNNIIHRDLKPDNIILHYNGLVENNIDNIDNDIGFDYNYKNQKDLNQDSSQKPDLKNNINIDNLHIKIIDFGFARFTYDNELLTSTLGSALHMDPRILKKMKKIENFNYNGYNKDADIWSLGCILYEMVIGYTPFNSLSYEDLFKKLDLGKFYIPVNLNLSYDIIDLINGMLRSDIKRRLTITNIVDHNFIKTEFRDTKEKIVYRKKNISLSENNLIFDINDQDNFRNENINNNESEVLNIIESNQNSEFNYNDLIRAFDKMGIDYLDKDYSNDNEINQCIDVLIKGIGNVSYSLIDTKNNVYFDINKKFAYNGFFNTHFD